MDEFDRRLPIPTAAGWVIYPLENYVSTRCLQYVTYVPYYLFSQVASARVTSINRLSWFKEPHRPAGQTVTARERRDLE